jgi:hypothetical protein
LLELLLWVYTSLIAVVIFMAVMPGN